MRIERRAFLFTGSAALLSAFTAAGHSAQPKPSVALPELEARLGGRIGLAAMDTGSGARLSHRAGERFAMCSTFKWMLAATVLAKADQRALTLDQMIAYGPTDLLDNSPVTREHVGEGALSVNALCAAAVERSDNAAANVLLRFIGGPQAVTGYLRGIGDSVTRLDRFEPDMSSNLPADPRDTTTADAMIATMQKILLADALSTASRATLLDWLKNCQTGLHRLRAGLPEHWAAADKTGTGPRGANNDNAIFWPPGRAPILIAAYLSDSNASSKTLEAAHAQIGRIVAAAFS
jgi:beta-lactamase class A